MEKINFNDMDKTSKLYRQVKYICDFVRSLDNMAPDNIDKETFTEWGETYFQMDKETLEKAFDKLDSIR